MRFPSCIQEQFSGPRFGAEGLRRIQGRPEKPLVGTIVKPKIGIARGHGGSTCTRPGGRSPTNSKDDETLVDQRFCPIEDRTKAVAESLDRLKEEGQPHGARAVNISTGGHRILELAEKVQSWEPSR